MKFIKRVHRSVKKEKAFLSEHVTFKQFLPLKSADIYVEQDRNMF